MILYFLKYNGSHNYKTLICHLGLEDIFPSTIIIIIERQQLKGGGLLILNQVKNNPHSLRLHDFSWGRKIMNFCCCCFFSYKVYLNDFFFRKKITYFNIQFISDII